MHDGWSYILQGNYQSLIGTIAESKELLKHNNMYKSVHIAYIKTAGFEYVLFFIYILDTLSV